MNIISFDDIMETVGTLVNTFSNVVDILSTEIIPGTDYTVLLHMIGTTLGLFVSYTLVKWVIGIIT